MERIIVSPTFSLSFLSMERLIALTKALAFCFSF